MRQHLITIALTDDEGYEEYHELPALKEVCSDCGGHGTVLNESLRHHAYTAEEFLEEFDEEGRAQYFAIGGIYDVRCPTCQGTNVVDVIDRETCQQSSELQALLERWDQQEQEQADTVTKWQAISRMERMMGC